MITIPVFDEQVHASATTVRARRVHTRTRNLFIIAYACLGFGVLVQLLTLAMQPHGPVVFYISALPALSIIVGVVAYVWNAQAEQRLYASIQVDFARFMAEADKTFFAANPTLPPFTARQRTTLLRGGWVDVEQDDVWRRYVPTRTTAGYVLRTYQRETV